MSWIWTWTFICQVVPDVIDNRAVVAMVGLDTVWMGEETPMDCDDECAEWDIRNEFETVDGMPVYYGGDLYDSDDSDWEDPRDLAYAEYVDRYKFDAPEGFELKVFDRSKAVDVPVMMVGEVTGPGYVRQKLSSCLLPEADMVCAEPVADILTVGHDVPGVVESPIHQNSCQTDGGGVAFYYEGDLNDSDCGSVGDQELDTWEDWCDSAFEMDMVGFPRILMIHSRRLCSVARCFGVRTLPSRHECCRTVGMCLYRHCRFSLIQ